ncbi:class I tRNA ligase family protein [Nonomuraea dietziae]
MLEVLTRVMAPLAPLVTEEIWKGLTGGRGGHLTPFPPPSGGTWSPRWTRCARCAPRPWRCARRRGRGCACRCPG